MATMEQSEKVIDVEIKEGEGKTSSPIKRKSEVSDSTMESPVKKQLKPSSEEVDAEKEAKEAEEALLKDDEEAAAPAAGVINSAEVEEAVAAVTVDDKEKKQSKGKRERNYDLPEGIEIVDEIGSSDDVDTEPEQNGNENEKVAADEEAEGPKETVEPEASN